MTPEFTLSAYDPATGDLVWQQRAPTASAIGASGNLVTSGDLVIQGTDVGGVFAYDARTGEVRFSYRHNRAIRASPMTYAVQRQAVHLGGRQQRRADVRAAVVPESRGIR